MTGVSKVLAWITVLILLLGNWVLFIAAIPLGLLLLWASRVWTVREKLLGSLIPVAVFVALYVLLAAIGSSCSGAAACSTRGAFSAGDLAAVVGILLCLAFALVESVRLVKQIH